MPLVLNVPGINSGPGSAWPGVAGTNANASPQGPATAAQAGFGVSAGSAGMNLSATAAGVLSVGTLALIGLIYLWWSLPR